MITVDTVKRLCSEKKLKWSTHAAARLQERKLKGAANMCFYCKGKTMIPSVTTHVVTLNNCVMVVKNVPCEECEQ